MPVVATNDAGRILEGFVPNYGPAATIAAAGTVQANATAIVARVTVVTGADDAKGVVLPATTSPGDEYLVYSSQAANGLKVYPHSGGDINDGSANANITQEGKTLARFMNLDGTTWVAQFTANA